jgi:hypothetical protein
VTDGADDLGDYVRRVHENTQRYLRALIADNEKLCELIRTLEKELDRERRDRLHLEERIAAMDADRRAYLERYLDVEEQNANVSNLYVATLRLHRSVDHADVLMAIQEIIINLIGAEELAVFEVGPEGGVLHLSRACGIDTAPFEHVRFGTGIIGQCAESGRTHLMSAPQSAELSGEQPSYEAGLTACVPLVVEGVVTGVVAMFRLLNHKAKLEAIDHELLALLGSQAATALYCTRFVESAHGRKSLHARAASEQLET